LTKNAPINRFDVLCVPNSDVYSSPPIYSLGMVNTVPIATFQYKLIAYFDNKTETTESPIYTVSYYVVYTYHPIFYIPNSVTTIQEDTSCLISLDTYGTRWSGGNIEYRSVSITVIGFDPNNQNGLGLRLFRPLPQ
jgi:hypothetical protein